MGEQDAFQAGDAAGGRKKPLFLASPDAESENAAKKASDLSLFRTRHFDSMGLADIVPADRRNEKRMGRQ